MSAYIMDKSETMFETITLFMYLFRLLVGAPQAAGQGLLRGSRPGALFRCPITPEEYDCERVDIDEDSKLDFQLKQIFTRSRICNNYLCHVYLQSVSITIKPGCRICINFI